MWGGKMFIMKVDSAEELVKLGREYGAKLRGGEVIELVGDIGAGKTTFTRGIAEGLGVENVISSPSFVVMNSYSARDGLTLNHYDFYRLDDPGIMKSEIAESLNNPKNITVIEWGDSVQGVLPDNREIIKINYLPNSEGREVIYDSSTKN
jgi:tRNA threonylcarbamoyladenosine biosynthesis protein TsaE